MPIFFVFFFVRIKAKTIGKQCVNNGDNILQLLVAISLLLFLAPFESNVLEVIVNKIVYKLPNFKDEYSKYNQ